MKEARSQTVIPALAIMAPKFLLTFSFLIGEIVLI